MSPPEVWGPAVWTLFHTLSEKNWNSIKERKGQKKNKKFVDFLLRKGYETSLIFEKLKQLDK